MILSVGKNVDLRGRCIITDLKHIYVLGVLECLQSLSSKVLTAHFSDVPIAHVGVPVFEHFEFDCYECIGSIGTDNALYGLYNPRVKTFASSEESRKI